MTTAHATAIGETELMFMSDATQRDYGNRIRQFILWLQEEYPQTYKLGTRELTQEEVESQMRIFWQNPRPYLQWIQIRCLQSLSLSQKDKKD